jgi:hypothetical protein
MMGTSYRADCWAALEDQPSLSAAELARRTYASFATAWQVKRDFAIIQPGRRRRKNRAASALLARSIRQGHKS